jgi:lysylphosphatidylglycerol synthetase-like protein (DUF2156 family)
VSTQDAAPRRSPFERQLNIGLMVVQVIAALLVIYGVVFVASSWDGDGERTRFEAVQVATVFLVLPGTVVFFVARSARRRLTAQVVSARLFGILAGVFALLAGLPVLTTVFGLVLIVSGLFTLTSAVLLKREVLR